MRGKIFTGFLTLVALRLLALNVQVLNAHQWGSWHWEKSSIRMRVFGTHQAEAKAAIKDWDDHTQLSLPLRSSHTDVSVWGGNWGDTGWSGLAEIKTSSYDWWHKWCWCRIEHAHDRYNSFYGFSTGTGTNSGARGIFCQEVGHTFGLDHSARGSCMAKTYYSPSSNVSNSHDWSDVNAMY